MNRKSQRGFTLLEVIVAFAIFTLCAGVLYEAFAQTLRRAARLQNEQAALLIAESILDRAGVEFAVQEGLREETIDATYRWSLKAVPIEAPADERPYTVPTYDVTVEVSWSRSGSQGEVSLRKLILQAAA